MIARRSFITLLGGAAAAWPIAARAQQSVPVIGYISASEQLNPVGLVAFRKGLNETGYVEGRNVAIEFRTVEHNDQLPAVAAELVRRRVNVIFTLSNANAVQPAKAATTSIPIVFTLGSDPVRLGVVASLSRPGGNATGVTYYANTLGPKRLELLRELVPQATTIAFLVNPTSAGTEDSLSEVQSAAHSIGQQIIVLSASTPSEIDAAFASISRQRISALLVSADVYFGSRRAQLVALATRYGIPTCFYTREFAVDGGLMSYSDDRSESIHLAGIYVGRILKGEKPSDLPVLQPTKFEFVINLKTAKALGLLVPTKLLAFADEVIE